MATVRLLVNSPLLEHRGAAVISVTLKSPGMGLGGMRGGEENRFQNL